MGLFTRQKTDPETMALRARMHAEEAGRRAALARSAPHVLRASGIRIEPMSAERLRALAGQSEQWQSLAWSYRDMIGELRFALQFRARAISRVRFFPAQLVEDDDEPLALSLRDERGEDGELTERAKAITVTPALAEAAAQELGRLPLDAGYSFLGVWSENWDVTGDGWLYGRENPETREEEWEFRSIDDVRVQGQKVTIKDELGQPRPVNLSPDSGEELYRLWVPHPRSPNKADSALKACMDALEDIVLTGREMRAASRSRAAANGLMLIPNGFLDTQAVVGDSEHTAAKNKFMADFTATMLAPISNEGEAGAVVPAAFFADPEDIEAFRFERFEREDSPTLIAKLDKALTRMAQSLDIPPEIITGMADANHWSAWQIDSATFRHYLEPSIRLMADALTQAYLRRALLSRGFKPEEVKQVRVWYDAGQITENPNRRQDALDAFDRSGISPAALRKELGFNDQDAPTVTEMLLMIAARQGIDTAAAAKVLAFQLQQAGEDAPPDLAAAPAEPAPPAPRELPPADPDPTGTGGTGAPDTAPSAVAAAAWEDTPGARVRLEELGILGEETLYAAASAQNRGDDEASGWTLDTATGRRLAELDRQLREQIIVAADAALSEAIRRAGSRLRSKAQQDRQLVASLTGRPVELWANAMGRDAAFALGADMRFLLNQAWDELGGKFTTWVRNTVESVISRVLSLLGLSPDTSDEGEQAAERMRAAMLSRVDGAWARMQTGLDQWAERLLFDRDTGEPDVGEHLTVNAPAFLVRSVLAEIGGIPDTAAGFTDNAIIPTGEPLPGLADGTAVTRELAAAGVVAAGWEWQYNPLLARETFHAHNDLDGVRFASWSDPVLQTRIQDAWIGTHYRPGDHRGCLCGATPAYLVPPRPEPGTQEALAEGVRDFTRALADQVRDRLAQPSFYMAQVLRLAASDDAAGRRGTTAQRTRADWLHVQRLQRSYLEGDR